MVLTCETCGCQFRKPPSRANHGRGRYCSRACRAKGLSIRYTGRPGHVFLYGENNPNWRGRRTPRPCPVCGDIFATANKTCSTTCGHRLQALRISGKGNGNWIDEETWATRHYRKLIMRADSRCEKCGTDRGRLVVHHVDHDRRNNCKTNLAVLCRSCHQLAHR